MKNFRFKVLGPKPTCMPNFIKFWKGRVWNYLFLGDLTWNDPRVQRSFSWISAETLHQKPWPDWTSSEKVFDWRIKCSPMQVDAIKFSNAHQLPHRISAVNSENANNSENEERSSDNQKYSPIVVKLASMKDKHSLLKLAPDARNMKVNITRHLLMAMQVQRKTLIKTASRLYNQGKKFSEKWLAVNIAFMLTMKGWFHNSLASARILGFSEKNALTHVALRGNFSGPVCSTDPV